MKKTVLFLLFVPWIYATSQGQNLQRQNTTNTSDEDSHQVWEVFQAIPNWSEDISCILYTHCTPCHNPNGIAPFSLLDYNLAFSLKDLIRGAVTNGEMPPWPPDPTYQTHAHERVLTAEEIQMIQDWVDNGAPEGDQSLAPPPPVYAGNLIENPDWVASIGPYTSTAGAEDDYQCFVISNPHTTTKFITALEVIPGTPSIVHHVLIFKDSNLSPVPGGYDCFGGTGSASSEFFSGWAPGQLATFYPAGMGVRLDPGENLVLQTHYPEGSGGVVDNNTRVQFILSDDMSLRNVSNTPFVFNVALFIPANTVQTFTSQQNIGNQDITILSAFPHMHLIGQSIKSWAVTPTGTTIPLIDIPHWDFEWQGDYAFRNPVRIPANSVIHGEAVYDNTTANPHNPNNPPQTVTFGEATTDEMMFVFYAHLPYQSDDENIVIDTAMHAIEYCDTLSLVNCPPNLIESAIPILDGTYIAGESVLSTGLVPAGGTVIFDAGTQICLDPGFEVELNAVFETLLSGCN